MSLDPCPHRPPCPGCPRYGERGPGPEARAALARLAERAGLPRPEVHEGEAEGYRMRARLMVRGRATSPKVGIFQEGSHRIVDIPRCRVHHPRVNEVAAAVKRAVRETGVAPYADRPHRGDLRAVQVALERSGARAQVVIVGNATRPEPLAAFAEALRGALGDRLQGLWWNGNPERTNVILGTAWQHLAGEPDLRDEVAGISVHYPPGAFGQSHAALAEALAAGLRAAVPDGARVAELYAGCGPIGLGLLERCAEVRFNEVAPHGLVGLERGLAERPEAERARARIAAGPAAERLDVLEGADTVIVDPPRRGLDAPVLEALASRPPRRLLYASCGLASFERDAHRLLEAGLRLTHLAAWNLFPYTDHVETAATFESPAD
jgi:tRNA/tmRNA/rRNA uracil-C5-methylase (TrmA/RlmC/RlmD family)